jgi:hypothetical protein
MGNNMDESAGGTGLPFLAPIIFWSKFGLTYRGGPDSHDSSGTCNHQWQLWSLSGGSQQNIRCVAQIRARNWAKPNVGNKLLVDPKKTDLF